MKLISFALILFSVGCAGPIRTEPSVNAASHLGTVIQVDGFTSLNLVGTNYYLYDTMTVAESTFDQDLNGDKKIGP